MKKRFLIFNTLVIAGLLLTGCNFDVQDMTPTVEGIVEEPIVPLPELTEGTPTPSPSPSPSSTPPAEIVTQLPSPTPFPSETPIPTETPGPWEYVIQPGDTMNYIIQLPPFNYRNFDVIAEIVRLNENIANADRLPPPGSTILIPRPTSTPIPEGVELTAVIDATRGVQTRGRVQLAANTEIDCHIIREGETAVGIIEQYGGLTLEILSQLNAQLSFPGCDFEHPSGGPNCNVPLVTGQCVNVPLPTPTPTLSPTPSGSETPTLTPTYQAPNPVSPPENGIAPTAPVTLQWVSVGVLNPEEYYLVQVADTTSGTTWAEITKNTSIRLPDSLIPTDGQPHQIEWSVTVAMPNAAGEYVLVGSPGVTRTFQWHSR